jgi:hypothetical protein
LAEKLVSLGYLVQRISGELEEKNSASRYEK